MNEIRKYVRLIESFETTYLSGKELENEIKNRRNKVPFPVIDDHGMGTIPMNTNIDYLGVRVKMKPLTFLQLASNVDIKRTSPKIQTMKNIIRKGGAIAPPFLELEYDENKKIYRVAFHEGRHRMKAITMIPAWNDISVEVHIVIKGMKHSDISSAIRKNISNGIGQEEYPHLPYPENPIEDWLS